MLPGWHQQLEIYLMWCQQIRLSRSLGINHRQTLALPTWIRFVNLHTPLPRKFVRGSLSPSPSESHGIFYLWPKSLSIVPQSPKRGSVMDLDDQKASFDSRLIERVAGRYVPPQDFVETEAWSQTDHQWVWCWATRLAFTAGLYVIDDSLSSWLIRSALLVIHLTADLMKLFARALPPTDVPHKCGPSLTSNYCLMGGYEEIPQLQTYTGTWPLSVLFVEMGLHHYFATGCCSM